MPWRGYRTLLRTADAVVLVLGAFLASSGFLLPLLIALFPDPGQQSMTILVWSSGSTAGSLLVNPRGISRARLTAILGVGVAALAVAALVPGLVTMNIALFLLGFATAPIAAAVFYFTSQHFRTRHQAVIFGAITSVQLVSEGIGTSASGVMLDAAPSAGSGSPPSPCSSAYSSSSRETPPRLHPRPGAAHGRDPGRAVG